MYNNRYYSSSSSFLSNGTAIAVGIGICVVLALFGGIILHFTFLSKKNENKFTGFIGWLYDFLSFKKLMLESLLKIIYLIFASFVTLFSLVLLFVGTGNFGGNLLSFLIFLIGGNVAVRISYEFMLLLILICKNTSDINKKLSSNLQEPFVKPSQEPQPQYQELQPQVQEPQPQAQELRQNINETVMFCSNCGKQFGTGEGNCSQCGTLRQ